jgi:pre-mRNA-processing factor 40
VVCMCGVRWVQLLFEEYLERAKEKDEKEAKKRRRLADDFTNLLRNTKVRAWC